MAVNLQGLGLEMRAGIHTGEIEQLVGIPTVEHTDDHPARQGCSSASRQVATVPRKRVWSAGSRPAWTMARR